jgi:hypothetical protein
MFGHLFRQKTPAPPVPPGPTMADQAISWYADTLERHTNMIEDEDVLPLPKEAIKASIISKLSIVRDQSIRCQLTVAYGMLSTFQSLTESEKEIVKSYNKISKNVSHPDSLIDGGTKKAVVAAFATIWPAYRVIQKRAEHEHEVLMAELKAVGVV